MCVWRTLEPRTVGVLAYWSSTEQNGPSVNCAWVIHVALDCVPNVEKQPLGRTKESHKTMPNCQTQTNKLVIMVGHRRTFDHRYNTCSSSSSSHRGSFFIPGINGRARCLLREEDETFSHAGGTGRRFSLSSSSRQRVPHHPSQERVGRED